MLVGGRLARRVFFWGFFSRFEMGTWRTWTRGGCECVCSHPSAESMISAPQQPQAQSGLAARMQNAATSQPASQSAGRQFQRARTACRAVLQVLQGSRAGAVQVPQTCTPPGTSRSHQYQIRFSSCAGPQPCRLPRLHLSVTQSRRSLVVLLLQGLLVSRFFDSNGGRSRGSRDPLGPCHWGLAIGRHATCGQG